MSRLDDTFLALLRAREAKGRLRKLKTKPAHTVDFSSNGYLSLSTNLLVRTRYIAKIEERRSDFALGSGGSRLLDGNSPYTNAVETEVTQFHGGPSGLFFNSGYEANVAIFGYVPQPGDIIVYDELIHASVHDGMKLSRATQKVAFGHNCVTASGKDMPALEEVLDRLVQGVVGQEVQSGLRNVFVAVESVYSMEGDVAPLSAIVECVERLLPQGNGHVVVDEAHSTGLLGQDGRGLVCHHGLEGRVWARLHTFGKAIGCSGGKSLRKRSSHRRIACSVVLANS